MLLWISLTLSILLAAAAVGIVLRRMMLLRRPVGAALDDESKPVKRRKRIIHTSAAPPPPPPPASVADAASAEAVSFEKLIDLVDVNLETNNLVLAEQYLEELRGRFMDKPPIVYFEHRLSLAAKKGDADMELSALEQMVQLEPEELGHVEKLAAIYVRLDRLAEAEALLGEALAAHPDNLPLLKTLATMHRKTDAHEKAVELKQRIYRIEEELRHLGQLPPDPDSYTPPRAAPAEEPKDPPTAA